MHKEIKLIMSAVNKSYNAMIVMFSSMLLSPRTTDRLYGTYLVIYNITYLHPIVIYVCKTLTSTK